MLNPILNQTKLILSLQCNLFVIFNFFLLVNVKRVPHQQVLRSIVQAIFIKSQLIFN